ncbi:MAG: hypothetical protein NUW01_00050 [Gemmatimonadaceae bacterium]|nr:hypothetical protein [Gemmatimonadaceae bacterium]
MDAERYAAHMLNYHGIATAPCGCTYNAPRCSDGQRLFVAAFHERRATDRTIALMAKGARDAFEAAINTEDRWMAHYRNENTIPASQIVATFNEYMGNDDD